MLSTSPTATLQDLITRAKSHKPISVAVVIAEQRSVLDPDSWHPQAENHEGSWWPCWQAWLFNESGPLVDPPVLGNTGQIYRSICDAPGTYVFDA